MEIIHCAGSLSCNSGGPSRSIPALAAALAQRGIAISLLRRYVKNEVPFPEGVFDVRLTGQDVTLLDQASLPLGSYLGGFDIVHSHGIWTGFNHLISTSNSGRHIISPRGMLEPWALNNSKWKKKLAWWVYQYRDLKNATAFHATALSEAENIRKLGFKQPIAVIPNGIVLPDVAWRREQRAGSGEQAMPHAPCTMPKKRTALFLSRIHPKKGLPMLLDAWARIRPENWRLVIAGNDEVGHTRELEAKITVLGLESVVELAGPLFDEAKEQAYLNADLFILPSYSENFGIVVTEALGYGVPVLTTTGCPWQELETHSCGWWVEPTIDGIQAGLNKALGTTNEELSAMGARGRALVEEKYQWPGIAERMLEFYEWILNGGSQPTFVV